MSYPVLYESNATDFFSNGLGTLPDALTATVTEERNGEFVFDMTYPLHGSRAGQIKNNRIIKVDAGHLLKDQRFVVKTVTPTMDNSGKTIITVHAEHVCYLSNDLAIQPQLSMTDMTAEQALNFWNRNLTTPNQFTVDSDITTHNGTTWSIDKVQTARQALGGVEGSILDVWGGEYRFDNLHISLLSKRGTVSNTLLAYGRNITSFEQEQNIMDTYTSVYPYFIQKGDKDEQDTIYTIDNYVVDSANVDKFPNKKPLPLDLSSELGEIKVGTRPSDASADDKTEYISVKELQSRMKTYAQQYIKNNNIGVPKVSIKVSFVDLSKTANYADVAPLEQLDLCDNVPIKFPELDIDTTAKVSRVIWNVLTDSYDSLELGNISATLGDKISQVEQNINKTNNKIDEIHNYVQVGADGKSTIFRGSDTPIANHVGDLWYKPNGEDTEMYQWDSVSWHFVMSTKDTHDISDKVDAAMQEMADKEKEINGKLESNQIDISQAQKDLEQVKQDTANQLADIRDSVVKDVADAKAQSKDALDKANGVDDKASQALENATEAKETVISVATDMDTVKGEIFSKADKSTVDTINQTVSDQGTKITQNANDIKSKASSSDVDKLSGRVSTAETTLLQTAQGLTGKADTTQLNKLSGDLTTLSNNFSTTSSGFQASLSKIDDKVNSNKEETDSALQVAKADIKATADNLSTNYTKTTDEHDYVNSQIKQSADKLEASVASVSDVANAEDTNLIFNGSFKNGDNWKLGSLNTHFGVDASVPISAGTYINFSSPTDVNTVLAFIQSPNADVLRSITGNTVTMSIYARCQKNGGRIKVYIRTEDADGNYSYFNSDKAYDLTTAWARYSMTAKLPTGIKAINLSFQFINIAANVVCYATGAMLTVGSILLPYAESTLDSDAKIAKLEIDADGIRQTVSNKADTSYVDQKANQITSTVGNKADISYVDQQDKKIQSTVASKADASQITQLSDQINLKVNQTDFDNMQVGGRNYVTNGNFTDGTNGWTKFGNIDTYQIWGDGRLVYGTTKAINKYTGVGQNNIPISGNKGDSITVSFDACYFGDNPSNYAKYINIIVHYNDNSGTIVSQESNTIDMSGSVQKYSFTVKSTTDFSTVNVRFVYNPNTLYKNKLGRVKVEAGTKATDYSDSPDDKADKANLVSQINIDKSGVLIQGKKIMIDGDATIKNAVIKSSMIDTLDASKITTGTLNAANVNIINLNANNITTGTLKGTNLSMNLNTGEVLFQKGSIKSTNGKLNISVDDGTMSVTNSSNEGIYFKDGRMMLSNSNPFNNQKLAYGLVSYEVPWVLNGGLTITGHQGALLTATNKSITESSYNNNHPWFRGEVGNIDFYGGFNNGSGVAVRENDVVIGSARGRVDISGGTAFTPEWLNEQPHIEVGTNAWNKDGIFNDSKSVGKNIAMNAFGIDLAASSRIAAHTPIFTLFGDFTVTGKKNAVVSTSKGDVAIDAYETAEYYFGDIGTLNTGKSGCAKVIIDSLFNETVNTSIPYHVFITAYEESYIWVTDRTATSFIVHSSKPNVDVSYEIKAKRLGYEGDRLEIQKEDI